MLLLLLMTMTMVSEIRRMRLIMKLREAFFISSEQRFFVRLDGLTGVCLDNGAKMEGVAYLTPRSQIFPQRYVST